MSEAHNKSVHKETLELLPWYANGSLTDPERARVESHLADCGECREELAQCRDLRECLQAYSSSFSHVWRPDASGVERVLHRIACEGAIPETGASERIAESGPRGPGRHTASRRTAGMSAPRLKGGATDRRPSRPLYWLVVGQSVALAGMLAAFAFWQPLGPVDSDPREGREPAFETLTRSASTDPSAGRRAQVIFQPTTEVKEIQALLLAVGGSIVKGPYAQGRYDIEFDAHFSRDQLKRFEDDRRVLFAQPMPGTSVADDDEWFAAPSQESRE